MPGSMEATDLDDLLDALAAEEPAGVTAFVLEPAPDRAAAWRTWAEFGLRHVLGAGGGLIGDDGFITWADYQPTSVRWSLSRERRQRLQLPPGRRIGALHYPDLPDPCLVRLHAIWRARESLYVAQRVGIRVSTVEPGVYSSSAAPQFVQEWARLATARDLVPVAYVSEGDDDLTAGLSAAGFVHVCSTTPPEGIPPEHLWLPSGAGAEPAGSGADEGLDS